MHFLTHEQKQPYCGQLGQIQWVDEMIIIINSLMMLEQGLTPSTYILACITFKHHMVLIFNTLLLESSVHARVGKDLSAQPYTGWPAGAGSKLMQQACKLN
jgi:hypothetical protein